MNSKILPYILIVVFVTAFVLMIVYSSVIAKCVSSLAQYIVKLMLGINWWENLV